MRLFYLATGYPREPKRIAAKRAYGCRRQVLRTLAGEVEPDAGAVRRAARDAGRLP